MYFAQKKTITKNHSWLIENPLSLEVDGLLIGGVVAPAGTKVHVTSLVVANPDGKVRESHDKRVLTRNITERVQETEERIHKGDTTHDVSTCFILIFRYTYFNMC